MAMMEIASFTDPCEEHFHIFMPSSFPLKTREGRGWRWRCVGGWGWGWGMDPAWHAAFDAFTAVC